MAAQLLPDHLAGLDGQADSIRLRTLAIELMAHVSLNEDVPLTDVAFFARELNRIAGSVLRMETALDSMVGHQAQLERAVRAGLIPQVPRRG